MMTFLIPDSYMETILTEDHIVRCDADIDGGYQSLRILFGNGDEWRCVRNRPRGKNTWQITERVWEDR